MTTNLLQHLENCFERNNSCVKSGAMPCIKIKFLSDIAFRERDIFTQKKRAWKLGKY